MGIRRRHDHLRAVELHQHLLYHFHSNRAGTALGPAPYWPASPARSDGCCSCGRRPFPAHLCLSGGVPSPAAQSHAMGTIPRWRRPRGWVLHVDYLYYRSPVHRIDEERISHVIFIRLGQPWPFFALVLVDLALGIFDGASLPLRARLPQTGKLSITLLYSRP